MLSERNHHAVGMGGITEIATSAADAQIGRVIEAIERMGLRDNTLIVYCVGDNGPSAEGSLTGTLNNMKTQLGLKDDVKSMPSTSMRSAARFMRTTTWSDGVGPDRRRSSG
jgi:arylsulfatase A-like enzyme